MSVSSSLSLGVAAAVAVLLTSPVYADKNDPIVKKYIKQGYSERFAECMWRGVSGQNDKRTAFSERETFDFCRDNGYN